MSTDIEPFTIAIADDVLDDLRRRIEATRWPEPETVDDWSQGIPLAAVRELVDYWLNQYDWRTREAALNRDPAYTTELDGLDIHFQHIRSSNPDALPLIVTHGWPGSFVEFHHLIPLLTEPQDHGGDAADAFHLVVPSLPGFGFSAKPTTTGWGAHRVATAWHELMTRLGYGSRYVAQGGDWGAVIVTTMGHQAPRGLRAIHTNMPIAVPTPELLENLDAAEQAALDAFTYRESVDGAYYKLQATRPQTIGYGLVDSPVGLLAWVMEKVAQWTDRDTPVTDHIGVDNLLDNVMIYWLTASGASSARIYWEIDGNWAPEPVGVPTCVSTFPNEIIKTSRRWAEATTYPTVDYWNDLDHGGHFPAWQLPEVMAAELTNSLGRYR